MRKLASIRILSVCVLGCILVAVLWAPVRTSAYEDSALVFVEDNGRGAEEDAAAIEIEALFESTPVARAILERFDGTYERRVVNPTSTTGAVFVTIQAETERLAGRLSYLYAETVADVYNAERSRETGLTLGFRQASLFGRSTVYSTGEVEDRHTVAHLIGGGVVGLLLGACACAVMRPRRSLGAAASASA